MATTTWTLDSEFSNIIGTTVGSDKIVLSGGAYSVDVSSFDELTEVNSANGTADDTTNPGSITLTANNNTAVGGSGIGVEFDNPMDGDFEVVLNFSDNADANYEATGSGAGMCGLALVK